MHDSVEFGETETDYAIGFAKLQELLPDDLKGRLKVMEDTYISGTVLICQRDSTARPTFSASSSLEIPFSFLAVNCQFG